MAPKQPCAKFEYVVTPEGTRLMPADEPHCKDEESPADYNAGGYLPVKVGDSFNNRRYRVVRKLGWGHFSTVWLVKDASTKRHSALKVVKSAGRYTETALDEIKLLSRVAEFSPTHSGREHIVSFLDSFTHQGPEAKHICIVFEPLGENLLALIERNKKKGVPRPLVKVIAKQILLGLEYLHDECDLVHTDIKPENILISIPDIEAHIHNELSVSPTPTSRRVGVPLPTKTRAGMSIPSQHQRPRKQVQIFESQPLASPSRSAGKSAITHVSMSMNARSDNASNESVGLPGSYAAQIHLTRTGGYTSGTVGSLSSSAPKVPSGLSSSAPRTEPAFLQKRAELFAARGITAVPPRIANSPSASSSSSSISSALASMTAGSSSLVSTPPTSLSHSLGNAVMEFMGTGKFENELRTGVKTSPESKVVQPTPVPAIIPTEPKVTADLKTQAHITSVISSSWKATTAAISSSWTDKISISLSSNKSHSSPNNTSKSRTALGAHNRSHSGMSNPAFWKDPGGASLAPAILVSTVVSSNGHQDDFFKLSTVEPIVSSSASTSSETSSATATIVRPSPNGTPIPIPIGGKKSSSLINGVSRLINDTSSYFSGESPRNESAIHDLIRDNATTTNQHTSLLTQTAPLPVDSNSTTSTVSPSKRTITRLSPPQQVSQLSAHMHLHKPVSEAHPDGRTTKLKSRSSWRTEHPSMTIAPAPSASVTPTPVCMTPPAPPPTPIDSSPLAALIPPLEEDTAATTTTNLTSAQDAANDTQPPTQPRTLPPLRTPADDKPVPPPISIKIADLGNATPSKKHYTDDIQTRQYRAPEAILGRRDWDARADIWSVACVLFELLTAEYLFDPQSQGELFSKDDDHMAQIIELLGDFALEVKMGGKYSRELFDHTGALRYIRTLKPWPLKRVMIEKYLFAEADATRLCEFLEPMLATDMRDRAHARDLKTHKWLEITKEDGVVTEW
ncbi:kinase-like protein [Pholiota conissans]|uniref:non-specific serine/threonine protein kinase n=1 Tax=Pholiota conissans TaxID=109636 RepID=A0A9P5Z5E0_9AGAR|nr:kinase-like protein [Pholiota conissans]